MIHNNFQITDTDIQALIDGELEAEKREKVCNTVKSSSNHLRRYNEIVKQKCLIQDWWRNKSAE